MSLISLSNAGTGSVESKVNVQTLEFALLAIHYALIIHVCEEVIKTANLLENVDLWYFVLIIPALILMRNVLQW